MYIASEQTGMNEGGLKFEQYLTNTLLELPSPPTLAALSDRSQYQTPTFLFSPLKQKNEVY
jgi:hypothetical protein